jgi:hypothetical protein
MRRKTRADMHPHRTEHGVVTLGLGDKHHIALITDKQMGIQAGSVPKTFEDRSREVSQLE